MATKTFGAATVPSTALNSTSRLSTIGDDVALDGIVRDDVALDGIVYEAIGPGREHLQGR